MGERIKLLRKALGLTQEEFGKKIGIKRNTIATYEIGRNVPIDAVIFSICRTFNVNEVWLRTGLGGEDNMFVELSDDDRYSISLGKLGRTENEFVQNAINAIAETKPEDLKIIEEFMKKCLGIK